MSKDTRQVVMKLMLIQSMLKELIEGKIDGEPIAALNLALDFVNKALVEWGELLQKENLTL